MKLKKIIFLALNSLLHSKLRSWLTILGIVIGIGSFIAILSLSTSMESNIRTSMDSLQLDIITVTPGASRAFSEFRGGGGGMPPGMDIASSSSSSSIEDTSITNKDISAILSISNISVISKEISGSEKIYYLGDSLSQRITGVDVVNWLKTTNIVISSGRNLNSSDKYSLLIGDRIAENSFDNPILLNTNIVIEDKSFRVVGIIKNSSSLIVPIDTAVNIISDKEVNYYDSLTIKVSDEDKVDEVVTTLNEKLLISRKVTTKTKNFSISAIKDNVESMDSTSSSMILFLAIIAGISLVVGAIGIANTMFTSVLEKTKEIGIMKSIGASSKDILLIFISNAALFGFVGGVFGVLLGGVLSSVLSSVIGIGMLTRFGGGALSFSLSIYGILLAIGISVLSGLIPAYRASKLKPVDALRYE